MSSSSRSKTKACRSTEATLEDRISALKNDLSRSSQLRQTNKNISGVSDADLRQRIEEIADLIMGQPDEACQAEPEQTVSQK